MISVVIITRNEEFNIARTLAALEDSRISEVIVVDSQSSDKTCEIVNKHRKHDPRIKLIILEGDKFTAAKGRQMGLSNLDTHSKYCLFLDGDMELDANFLEKAITILNTSDIGGLTGQRTDYLYDTEFNLVKKREQFYDTNKEMYLGGAFIVKTEYLLKYGNFDINFPVLEETFFYARFKKHGITFIRIPDHMFIHHMLNPDSGKHIMKRIMDRKIQAFGIILFHIKKSQVSVFIKKISKQLKVMLLLIFVIVFQIIYQDVLMSLVLLVLGQVLLGVSISFSIRSILYLSFVPIGYLSEALMQLTDKFKPNR